MTPLQAIALTATMLAASNLFMTFASHGRLKHLEARPLWFAALASRGIARFECLPQVPANRLGSAGGVSPARPKILREVVALVPFVPFAMRYMGEGLKSNFLWTGLCLVGAVHFIVAA